MKNPLFHWMTKKIKKERTSANLVYDLMSYLAQSNMHSAHIEYDVSLPTIIRESITDESFNSALYTVAGKMLDLFDGEMD